MSTPCVSVVTRRVLTVMLFPSYMPAENRVVTLGCRENFSEQDQPRKTPEIFDLIYFLLEERREPYTRLQDDSTVGLPIVRQAHQSLINSPISGKVFVFRLARVRVWVGVLWRNLEVVSTIPDFEVLCMLVKHSEVHQPVMLLLLLFAVDLHEGKCDYLRCSNF